MDAQLTLSDGRKLGYREFGAPNGFPILNNHGGLVCGNDIAPADEIAKQIGARIISPDRPGVATSALKKDRTLLDWTNDVRELADQLQLAQFSIFGWSMGGQYALACAHALSERVKRTVIVAGCLPLDDEKNFAALNRMDQKLTNLAKNHPHEAELAFKGLGEIAQHAPHMWNELTARGLSESDAHALEQIGAENFSKMSAPALMTADGMVEEYRAWALPWGFGLNEMRGAVSVWQGDADKLVPPQWAETFAAQIPHAQLQRVAGEGHFLAYNNHFREILNGLIG